MFKGSSVALVTPMQEDGSIDKKALHELVEWHIQSKTQAIIVAGSTGEAATLNAAEKSELVSLIVKQVAGRIPVIAGTGSNSTRDSITLAENAKRDGADACLIVTPYYNKPPQNGLYLHFKAIAEKVAIPIILYNVPGRTACDMLPETIERLAKIDNIIGIKEATGKVERITEIAKRCSKDFLIYSGDDATAMESIFLGAQGDISVTANVAPVKMYQMCEAALAGNRPLAEKLNNELMLLHQRLFIEANPIPTKWVLHTMGKIPAGIRLPLVPLSSQHYQGLKEAMQHAGVY
jgi:4-hydroxy-tetrahydrodipicolinate synthase